MSHNPPPPPELLYERPHLADEPQISHPVTDPRLGNPPRKYSIAVHERICDELRKGQRPQGACARAGITTATFYEWVRRGKGGDPWLSQFAEDVEIAFNEFEARTVDVVHEGLLSSDAEVRAKAREDAKWVLERERPDGFSKQVKSQVETQVNQFLDRLESALPPDIYLMVLNVYLGQAPALLPSSRNANLLAAPSDTAPDAEIEEPKVP